MKHDPHERVLPSELEEWFKVGHVEAGNKYRQIREYHEIERGGFVRWKHVYAWEEAKNKGMANRVSQ